MEYYTLTQAGRKAITPLREKGGGNEADILDYLQEQRSPTVEQIADGLSEKETAIRFKLTMLMKEGWVKRKRTKSFLI